MKLMSKDALQAVQALRRSGALEPFRDSLRAKLGGRTCLVLGSAPNAMAPDHFDACICINGSVWTARRLGLPMPDITVVVGYSTLTNNPVRMATREIWRGLETKDVLFVEAGASVDAGRLALDGCGFRFQEFQSITTIERAAIIGDVCGVELGLGKRDDRVSNGVFAAILALWADAREVVLAGISAGGGHSYIEVDTPRYHAQGDEAFLKLARELPVSTTATELHGKFGLALVDSREMPK